MLSSLLLAVATSAIGSLQWTLPSGWESLHPPAGTRIAYIYMPRARGGPVITVEIEELSRDSSLRDETASLAQGEADDGRTIESIKSRATCYGKQPGMDVYARFGKLVSQFWHVTVAGEKVYVFNYTYAPGAAIPANVTSALDSLCPAKPSAPIT